MSQVDETLESQVIAVGLIPLLKEYAQRLNEISDNARRLQEFDAETRQTVRSLEKQRALAKSSGMRDDLEAKGLVAVKEQLIQRAQSDFDNVRFALKRMLPSSDDLARQASQLVEHGKLEPVTRLELGLRLADFESALRQAQQRIAAGLNG